MRSPSHSDVRPVRDLVTDEEAYEAMQFLDNAAHRYGELRSNADYLEYIISVTESVGATLSDERSVDKRKWDSRGSPAYLEALKAAKKAKQLYYELEAKREAARIRIDVWRTIHADKRQRDVPEPGRR